MTIDEEDRNCDSNGVILTDKIQECESMSDVLTMTYNKNYLMNNNNLKQPFKRQLTSASCFSDNVSNEED